MTKNKSKNKIKNKKEEIICQSCGTPIQEPADYGSEEFCVSCYKNGKLINPDKIR